MDKQPSLTEGMSIDILSECDDLFEKFHELTNIVEMVNYMKGGDKGKWKSKVIKYIVLLYSFDSILNKRPVIELNERKMKAADMVGFTRHKGGDFEKRTKELFDLDDSNYIDMVFGFLKYQNETLWKEIVATEGMVDQYIKGMMQVVDMDDDKKALEALNVKSKLRQEVRNMNQDLKDMYRQFYKDHSDVQEKVVTKKKSDSIESRVINA